jgi:hypothetical protein
VHVLQTGAAGPFLVAADEQRVQAQAAPDEQGSHPRRAAHLVRAQAHQVGAERAEVDGHVARRLGGVHVDQHTALPAAGHHLVDRLRRADLVVAPLEVDERGVGPHRRHQLVSIHPAPAVAPHQGQLVPGGTEPYGGVLHGRRDHVGSPSGPGVLSSTSGGTVDRGGDRLGGAAREHHLSAARPEERRHLFPRLLDRHARHPALVVDAGGIASHLAQAARDRLHRLRTDGRRRGVI